MRYRWRRRRPGYRRRINRCAGLAILLEHNTVDRRENGALVDVELRVVDRGLGFIHRGARDLDRVDGDVKIVLRFVALLEQRLHADQLGVLKLQVGDGELVVRHRLLELGLVVAVVDLREQIALLDVPALFDRLSYDLAQNLGADRDVLCAGDHVAGAAQQLTGLAGALDGHRRGFDLERASERVQPAFVAAAHNQRDDYERNYRGQRAVSPLGLRAAGNAQRFQVQNVRSALRLGHGFRFS